MGQRGPKTYRILTRLEGSVGPDSILLVEGSIVDPVTSRSNFSNKYGGGEEPVTDATVSLTMKRDGQN